jgi:hypothetical protein
LYLPKCTVEVIAISVDGRQARRAEHGSITLLLDMLLFYELGFVLTDLIGGWLYKRRLKLRAWLLHLWFR